MIDANTTHMHLPCHSSDPASAFYPAAAARLAPQADQDRRISTMFTLRRTTALLTTALLILGGLTSNATARDCVVTDSGDPPPGEPTAGTTLRSVPSRAAQTPVDPAPAA